MNCENQTKVVLIGGASHSGSTLLDMLLGEIPGFLAVGELRHLWRRWAPVDRICGCGKPYVRCSVWSGVFGLKNRMNY